LINAIEATATSEIMKFMKVEVKTAGFNLQMAARNKMKCNSNIRCAGKRVRLTSK